MASLSTGSIQNFSSASGDKPEQQSASVYSAPHEADEYRPDKSICVPGPTRQKATSHTDTPRRSESESSPTSPPATADAQQKQPDNVPAIEPKAQDNDGPQPEAQDNHHDERQGERNPLLQNAGTRNDKRQETTREDEPLLQNTGTRNRRKLLSFILICAIVAVCSLAVSVIFFALFEDRYTTPSTHQSRTMIQQGDIIILPIEENYCVSSERVSSLNITEVLPLDSIRTVALYKHLGDRSSLRNISSIPKMTSVTEIDLTTGEILKTTYAASYYTLMAFEVQILNIAPLDGFTSEDGSLTLYVLGSDEDAECFDEQGKSCHYIKRRSLNTKNGSTSVAYYQGFKPGYYLLYLLPQNVDITVAYNYTLQFDHFNPDDFTQPVCTIRAGNECDNITLRQNEGTVCFIASAVPTGSDQFFNLSTRVFYRPLHLHDPTTKTRLAIGVIFILITLSAMVLLVAGYKYQKDRT